MSSKFIHLHTHSHYSLLSALPKIPDLVSEAKKNDMHALALTDAGNMYGTIKFYKECKEQNIKPIIGVDFYVALRGRQDRQAGVDNKRFRLVCLAKNDSGYKNLKELVTTSYIEGFYYKPRIDKELMKKHSAGLIVILPSFSGEISDRLKVNDIEGATKILDFYKETFGEQDIYLEITHHPEIEGQIDLKEKIIAFAKKTNTPLVATHDVYYLHKEDKAARDTLLSIQSSGGFGPGQRINDENEDFSFITEKQAFEYFKDTPEAIENTIKIADRCHLEIELGSWVFPKLDIPEGRTAPEELRRLVELGIDRRKLERTPEIIERMEYELDIITTKGYAPYFLVVGDLLRFAHEHKILSNIRGSVSGSLVTYLAGITNINPLEYGIPFERFLNPDRPSPPDIDMDFADDRRDEVIQYARDKYGEDKVAQIGTFGTMMARGAVRDTARALGYPYDTGDKIAKLIPMGSQGFPMTIDRALEMEEDLKKLYKKDKDVKRIIDMAKKIEGCARHIGVHAAGVVIAPTTITDFTPLQIDTKGGKLITQFDMHCVEDAGLLKFDFLGLKNLAILANTARLVKKLEGIDVDVNNIPIDDQKTFEMLARGETMGLFQLNGQGMTKFLKDLKPTVIHDINAMVALYRPGPIQFIPLYIERKHNHSLVRYLDPALEPILKQSYGVLVYQDDLLMMARKIAGYSWLEVDKFRKAVGKKIPELMAKQKEQFIEGCIKTSNWSPSKAQEVWAWIEPFAAYGFNKAHSVSYGRVAYQTAYMKANYPVEYMTAILSADSGDVDKIHEAVAECKRMGIDVLPPDINESFGPFTVVKDEASSKIRFGLYTIKNCGEGIADTIIEERKKNGPYESVENLLERIQDKNLNKKSLESLIKCGALDSLGERGSLLGNLGGLLSYKKEKENEDKDAVSLFHLMSDDSTVPTLKFEEFPKATKREMLAWEKELLGLYVSGHPLDRIRDKLEKREFTINKIKESMKPGMTAVVCGMIESVKPIFTKKGDHMAFVKVADFTGEIEVVIFPKTFEENKSLIENEKCVAIKGRLSVRNDEKSIIAEAIKEL
ncbi:DNA polymerase III subunit alpha [Candidatus Campbellbacteria bacterium CG22_combo_CG10-13_8_21_14_all_36_13]|uniref:DNA polymerase III subunit alpha n=1 Tax=Candidatus Campbellbacteria bacterium CG22_combo_CG10-13_8_21_14_all_36_13 TaxID=1974529 RepID=A0A2H0DYI3_9BACT|nr:MAG: DNA polymerase III subunit alpha [Candidatus Campbellbacteria bacterium CG22_combo_CG10-13_8_21_14_all_36_13]